MEGIKANEATFTKLVFGKAWGNWKQLFKSVRRDLILGSLEALVGFGVFYCLRGFPVALDAVFTAAAFTFGPLALTVTAIFLWYLLISPAELAYEAITAIQLQASGQTIASPAARPINWGVWKQMDEWSLEQFAAILAKTDPFTSTRNHEKSAFLKIICDDVDNKKLSYIKSYGISEWNGQRYENEVNAYTRLKKVEALKWADAHENFDVSHVR